MLHACKNDMWNGKAVAGVVISLLEVSLSQCCWYLLLSGHKHLNHELVGQLSTGDHFKWARRLRKNLLSTMSLGQKNTIRINNFFPFPPIIISSLKINDPPVVVLAISSKLLKSLRKKW